MSRKIILSGLVVSGGLLLGRLMGFVREATLASTFGVSAKADIAVLALTIPDVLVTLLVAGGLSAALIPEFKMLSKKDAGILFFQSSLLLGVFFTVLTMLLIVFVDNVIFLFAPGLSREANEMAQVVMTQVLWLIPLSVLAGVSTAFLQSYEKFLMPALGTLIFNACIVLGLVWFVAESQSLVLLVYFIILGGLLRWGSQLWVLRKHMYFVDMFSYVHIHKGLLIRYAQAVMALGLLTLFPVVARSFASLSGEGSLAMVNYAWRLVELPLGLVVTVLAVVLFPKLAERHAKQDTDGFSRYLQKGLLWSVVMAVAIIGPILVSPETFVSVVYQWGDGISDKEVQDIANLLQVGVLILPFQAVIAMSLAAFNAKKKTKFPMFVGMIGFILLLPLCWFGQNIFGLIGVIWAMLLVYVLVSMVLLHALRKEQTQLALSALFFAVAISLTLSMGGAWLAMMLKLMALEMLFSSIVIMLCTIGLFFFFNKLGEQFFNVEQKK